MSSPNPTQPEEEYGNTKLPDEFAGIEIDDEAPTAAEMEAELEKRNEIELDTI